MWLNVWLHWRWSVIKTESPPTAVLNKSTEVRMQFPLLYMQKLCCNSCWKNSKGILVWLSLALVLYMEHEIHSKSIHVKSTCEELLSCSLLLPVVSKVTIGTFFFHSTCQRFWTTCPRLWLETPVTGCSHSIFSNLLSSALYISVMMPPRIYQTLLQFPMYVILCWF